MKEYEKSDINRIKRGQNRATYDVKKINKIIDAGFIGYVSYVYKEQAITLPMAYGRKENKIYLHSSQGNRMLLALLETKKMSMTIMHLDALILARSGLHHSVNYRSATLFGTVKKIENQQEKEDALHCFMEHMMKGRWDGIRPMHKEEIDRTLVVELTIESAAAKIRDMGVQDEKEDYNLPIWAGKIPVKTIYEYPIPDKELSTEIKIPSHILDFYNKKKNEGF